MSGSRQPPRITTAPPAPVDGTITILVAGRAVASAPVRDGVADLSDAFRSACGVPQDKPKSAAVDWRGMLRPPAK